MLFRRIDLGPELAILLTPYNAVYIEIPKVACSSIKVALAALLDIELDGPLADPHQSKFPLATASLDSNSLFDGYFSFAFVRNPYSRLLSCYRDKVLFQARGFTNSTHRRGVADCFAHYPEIQPDMSFGEFVNVIASIPDDEADAHFRSQYQFICNHSGEIALDFIGRFESLESDLIDIRELCNMPLFTLPRLQATGTGTNYRAHYTPTTRSLVETRFSKDIELLGYRF